mmetsp:Transcript_66464/g.156898  ORF Transcript_66464/g.156898 Transcript_66464/m.156898 type:complete len:82 (+) Transcript_66464:952-1197(+)
MLPAPLKWVARGGVETGMTVNEVEAGILGEAGGWATTESKQGSSEAKQEPKQRAEATPELKEKSKQKSKQGGATTESKQSD